jgi:hypothetical protein
MKALLWVTLGIFSTWYLTWSITSCAKVQEEGKPDWCDYNVVGPFRLYDHIRWFFQRPFIPPLLRENADCPYCVSFWAAFMMAFFIPVYENLSWVATAKLFFLLWIGQSGVVAFWYRRLRLLYALDAQDS